MKKIIIHSMLMNFMIVIGIAAYAHCDTRNGPLVKAAIEALRTNNVNLILIWVQPKDESELKTAFTKAVQVRKKDREAQQLADEYFFETAVRLHRMGEGEPFTGIKDEPAEPYVLSAERALETKSADSILLELNTRMQQVLDQSLLDVLNSASYNPNDLKAGRHYVARYIQFLHNVEMFYTVSASETIRQNEQEKVMAPVNIVNVKGKESSNSSINNTFVFLVIVALMILAFIMVFVLVQNRKPIFKHYHHDLHNGMAQHLAQ